MSAIPMQADRALGGPKRGGGALSSLNRVKRQESREGQLDALNMQVCLEATPEAM